MHLNLVQRVARRSQPPKEKRANRRQFVSRHVPRVFINPGRPFSSPRLCTSLLKAFALVPLFFNSRTICESRDPFSLFAFHGRFISMVVSFFCQKLKERFYEDQGSIVGICSSYAFISVSYRSNRSHVLRKPCLL